MDIQKLHEYIVLAHKLNFTAAADTLYLSQPTLSNHIKSIESEIQLELIERSPGNTVRLTPAGQEFLAMAQSIVKIYDETIDKLQSINHTISGTIRIRTPRYEFHPLLDYIQEFKVKHPDIEVVLSPWVPDDEYADIASGKVDCAYIGQGYLVDGVMSDFPDVKLVTYGNTEGFIWVDKNNPLATKETLSIYDLNNCCISIPANLKNDSWAMCLRSMASENNIDITLDEKFCDSLEDFILNKVDQNDLFIGFQYLRTIPCFDMRSDRIIRYFSPPLRFRMSIGFINNDNNPALSAFAEFLKEKYSSQALQ